MQVPYPTQEDAVRAVGLLYLQVEVLTKELSKRLQVEEVPEEEVPDEVKKGVSPKEDE